MVIPLAAVWVSSTQVGWSPANSDTYFAGIGVLEIKADGAVENVEPFDQFRKPLRKGKVETNKPNIEQLAKEFIEAILKENEKLKQQRDELLVICRGLAEEVQRRNEWIKRR